MAIFVGTAGWSIPKSEAGSFEGEGPALQRYASRFRGVEINSSFYRPHRPSTWVKWASLVPADFRFAVKIPKAITHERKLTDCEELLTPFCGQVALLGTKLAVLLVQLPPKLAFDHAVASKFFATFQRLTTVRIACEPRHPSWFEAEAELFLSQSRIARVAADPAPVPAGSMPGGAAGLHYWRLHGSPQIYRSRYGADRVADYVAKIEHGPAGEHDTWVMFDNTASSAATADALLMRGMVATGAE